jgi:NAD(P)-dependent dehydrogenase (short-subunit alcohol dehydrogenase family)
MARSKETGSTEHVLLAVAFAVTVLSKKMETKLTALFFVLGSVVTGRTFVVACAVSIVSFCLKMAKRIISPALRVAAVDMTGRTVIVTGANSGCGKETVRLLYSWNATVIMACRDTTKGERVAREMRSTTAGKGKRSGKILVEYLDLASLSSVRAFARRIEQSGTVLHGLINNAGVRTDAFTTTDDGVELQYQVNHLGHYLLTRLLLSALDAGATESERASRVVHVSSSAHAFGAVPESVYSSITRNADEALFRERMAAHVEGVYGDTKLMQVLFSNELDRRMQRERKGRIRSFAVHPGFVDTGFGSGDKRWLQTALVLTRPLLARDAHEVRARPCPALFAPF